MSNNEYFRKMFSKNLTRIMREKNKTQTDLINDLKLNKSAVSTWVNGTRLPRMDKVDLLANYFQVNRSDLIEDKEETNITPVQLGDSVSIPVFGSVPAGVPIEVIQDINEYIDIPKSWTTGGKEYFALTVKGDSMYPKYLEGDVVVVRVEEDCESGQDCVVYINGYDATLKKVIKRDDYLILQPLNTKYEPRMFDLRDEATPPVKIAGVVVEIRRRV